jgi:hypothetical protein
MTTDEHVNAKILKIDSYTHMQCKHIHAVQFSKLLRKKIYQDAILQPLQALQEKEVNPAAIQLGQIVCPKCFSQTYQKFGVRHNKYGDMQHYVCFLIQHLKTQKHRPK